MKISKKKWRNREQTTGRAACTKVSKPREQCYAYSRNPPANEQTEEKKQNILCVLDSSKNSACYRCLVHGLPRLPWRLARLPRARIRSTEKMAEGIKPDNVICLVTPGSARQDFLNQSFLKWRATSNNLFCKQSFKKILFHEMYSCEQTSTPTTTCMATRNLEFFTIRPARHSLFFFRKNIQWTTISIF